MAYEKETKLNWSAKLISADNAFLKSSEAIPEISGAKWIWPLFTTRGFLRKDFSLSAPAKQAHAHFVCDNGFDIYINGVLLAENIREYEADIASNLNVGENFLAFRVFQTADETYFSAGLCGEVLISAAGEKIKIITDESFHNFHPEFSNNEPSGWLSEKGVKEAFLVCTDIHPRLCRRSLYMRKTFELNREIASATLSVYSQGEAEMYINGQKIADEYFSQGIMEKYREYRTFDVTDKLACGKNAIAAITGNGWLNGESHNVFYAHKNALLAELFVKYADGTEQVIGTDSDWRVAVSPITDNDIQFGERYDARLEQEGWNTADFDDTAWSFAKACEAPLGKEYVKRSYPPIKVCERLCAVSQVSQENGILYDFGINCAGTYAITLRNTKAGQRVKISVCEMLNPNGTMNVAGYTPVCNSNDYYKEDGRAKAAVRNYDIYICKGGTTETYSPRFSFNGFRYIKVEGVDVSQIADLQLYVLHNDVDFGWKIESADPFYADFAKITERSMKGNMFGGFMDCPTREKNFWTGDIAIFAPTACYLADVETLLARWTDAGRKLGGQHFGWGDEIYIIPLTLYQFYGDKELLRARYSDILEYTYKRVLCVDGKLPDGTDSPYNDHIPALKKNLPPDFFASCFYCYNLLCASKIAEILGDEPNAQKLKSFFLGAKERFNDKYFIADKNEYTPGIQSGLVLPLAFSLVPDGHAAGVAAKLNEYVLRDGSLSTGFVATRYLMQMLCDYGYLDTAFMLLSREECPSWRYLLKNATTVAEHWDGMDPSGCSKNHFALGSITGWMFECLGGIRYNESRAGFEELYLKPVFIKQIGRFSCEFKTKHGVICSAWVCHENKVEYTVTTPVLATLELPNGEKTALPAGTHTIEIKL